jgi:hypothetical protein
LAFIFIWNLKSEIWNPEEWMIDSPRLQSLKTKIGAKRAGQEETKSLVRVMKSNFCSAVI